MSNTTLDKKVPSTISPVDEWLFKSKGKAMMTGNQALLRLLLVQRERDLKAGLKTASFVSGYRGSPLGGFDSLLYKHPKILKDANIEFLPAINEELAATSVWGTQQIDGVAGKTVDGVYSIWYGKGPGVERASDAMRHGNTAGSHPHGGVLVLYGDDHPGKSSTTAHQSEQGLAALSVPSLYPADVQDFIRFGILGWAMARYTGSWVGFKCVNETVDQTKTVDLDFDNIEVVIPELNDADVPPEGLHIRPNAPYNPLGLELIVTRFRLPLVQRFVRANRIDRVAFGAEQPEFGIVTAGKNYHDVIQALARIGITDTHAKEMSLGVYKVGCIWPLENEGLLEFAANATNLFFAEEKKTFLEAQAKDILYGSELRPVIVGKKNAEGEYLLPSDVQLEPAMLADALSQVFDAIGFKQALALNESNGRGVLPQHNKILSAEMQRVPYFCSGCPHSRSTKLPEGSVAMSGIGCHTMASFRGDGLTLPPTQMGGEGVNWIGLSKFVDTNHIFQNLGDGTYMHSGILAVRAAVAARTNITFKILYNDAVAMTGGQPHDGQLTVENISQQVLSEGAKKVVVVSENPSRFGAEALTGASLRSRDKLDEVQKELRDIEGCTVLIYDQTCAAEKRRRRKRGTFPDPAKRAFIYDAICEGCGDCSTISTCVSILPKETPLGVKRQIDQSSCNKDYSCIEGFCPSFVTVLNAEPKKTEGVDFSALEKKLPSPKQKVGSHATMIAGIGGTGVVTVGAVLARAAYLDGLVSSTYDMTGLAQKNGAVFSHMRVAQTAQELGPQRVGVGEADLVLAFDLLAALQEQSINTIKTDHTRLVGNGDVAVTSFFQLNRTDAARPPLGAAGQKLLRATGNDKGQFFDATHKAVDLFGNTIAVNFMVVGYAMQMGLLPVSLTAVQSALEHNGMAVDFNKNALLVGRVLAHDSTLLDEFLPVEKPEGPKTLDEFIAFHTERLTAFQNVGWSKKYLDVVGNTRAKLNDSDFTMAVVKYLGKLMTYKDEYEVARLYSLPEFKAALTDTFGTGIRTNSNLRFNLAPPLFSKRHPETGHLIKREFGPWMLKSFNVLRHFKGLRGTAFDIFGYSEERKSERRLIENYIEVIEQILPHADGVNAATALELAELPDMVRGYGHVKEKNIESYYVKQKQLLEQLSGRPREPIAVEAA